jgi:hypothetical protein
MKNFKLTGSQLKTLKRIVSGSYYPPPRPATHNNATFKTLARRKAIVEVDGRWVPSTVAMEFVISNGKLSRASY